MATRTPGAAEGAEPAAADLVGEPLDPWVLAGLPGGLPLASYLTAPNAAAYRLVVDVLLHAQQRTLTGVRHDELAGLLRERVGAAGVADPDRLVSAELFDLDARMRQLLGWGGRPGLAGPGCPRRGLPAQPHPLSADPDGRPVPPRRPEPRRSDEQRTGGRPGSGCPASPARHPGTGPGDRPRACRSGVGGTDFDDRKDGGGRRGLAGNAGRGAGWGDDAREGGRPAPDAGALRRGLGLRGRRAWRSYRGGRHPARRGPA